MSRPRKWILIIFKPRNSPFGPPKKQNKTPDVVHNKKSELKRQKEIKDFQLSEQTSKKIFNVTQFLNESIWTLKA